MLNRKVVKQSKDLRGDSTQTHFFYYWDIIYKNVCQDMCTYIQLKKNTKDFCATPQGVYGATYVPKLYLSSGKDISKCIEGGSMKLATQVDYVYM